MRPARSSSCVRFRNSSRSVAVAEAYHGVALDVSVGLGAWAKHQGQGQPQAHPYDDQPAHGMEPPECHQPASQACPQNTCRGRGGRGKMVSAGLSILPRARWRGQPQLEKARKVTIPPGTAAALGQKNDNEMLHVLAEDQGKMPGF